VVGELRAVLLQEIAEAHFHPDDAIVELAELQAAGDLFFGEGVEVAAELGEIVADVVGGGEAEVELAHALAEVGARFAELALEISDAGRERDAVIEERTEPALEMRDPPFDGIGVTLRRYLGTVEQRLQPFDGLALQVAEQALGTSFEIATGLAGASSQRATETLDLTQEGLDTRLALTEQRLPQLWKPVQELPAARLQPAKRCLRLGARFGSIRSPPVSHTLAHDALLPSPSAAGSIMPAAREVYEKHRGGSPRSRVAAAAAESAGEGRIFPRQK
jgi:hypothetical protein